MKTKLSPEEKKRLAIVIAVTSLLILGVSAFWWFTTGRPYRELMRNAEQQIHTPTPDTDVNTQPRHTEAGTSETPGAADTVSEAESPSPINTDTADTAAPTKENSTASDPSHTGISAEDQMIQDLLEEGERRIKAADALLESTDRLLENSDAVFEELIPRLAGELNAMSIEEQREFLKERRADLEILSNLTPPELRGMLPPEELDRTWKAFLDALAKEGYTPPEGF